MKILDIINSPWAITQDYLAQITDVYINHLNREKIDFKALGQKIANNQRDFEVINNNAIIPVSGPLTPHSSFFSFFFGGTGMDDIKRNIELAVSDGNDIILHINSPGGTVEGAFELADFIEEKSKNSSIIAFSDGQIASAAMLIASAADKTLITGKTNQIGSIGVISRKIDVTKANEEFGVKVYEFISGKFKNLGSQNRKTDEFERTEIQRQVDQLFTLFAKDFSRRRKINIETVAEWEARIFIGKDAIKNKLVDGVSTIEELTNDSDKGIMGLTLEKFKAENPDLFNQINDMSYKKGHEEGEKTGIETGAKSERLRISGIQSAAFPGQEELMQKLIEDGKTTAGEAAIQFNSAQKQTVAKAGSEIENDSPPPVDVMENQTQEPESVEEKDFMGLVAEYSATNKCGMAKAMKAVVASNPKEHQEYINKQNKG